MGNAASYIANNSPEQVGADIRAVISAQWSKLEASHAAAAAQGPEAEARWWGQTVGRIGFEVAAQRHRFGHRCGKAGALFFQRSLQLETRFTYR
jgi:hypothetical protein